MPTHHFPKSRELLYKYSGKLVLEVNSILVLPSRTRSTFSYLQDCSYFTSLSQPNSPNMNFLLGFVTLASLAGVYGQEGYKSTSMIPFPRIGRADRFVMADERSQGNGSPGLIPFPRIGPSDSNAIHEGKRQLIPFPRIGKRPSWRYSVDPYMFEHEDLQYPVLDGASRSPSAVDSSNTGVEESAMEKRNGNSNGMWFGPRLGRRKRSVVFKE